MATLVGATVLANAYPNINNRIQAANQFNAFLGAPWATTAQKVFYEEGQWPSTINQYNPITDMVAAGIFLLVCVKPLRTMVASEITNLTNFIALLQANGAQFDMTLWQEPNGGGTPGFFANGAAYTAYVNYYIGPLNAAGVNNCYVPLMYRADKAVSYYPGDANVKKILPDYYYTNFLDTGGTLGGIFNLAANHSGGPCPVGLGELGLASEPKHPSPTKFDLWLVNQVQVPLLTYVNQGGSIDKVMWYDGGQGANAIDAQTPGAQIITMLNFANAITNAEPVGAVIQGPDYPDFQTPQATANSIAATGAPLLALSGSVLADMQLNLNGSQAIPIPNLIVPQLGYEMQISATIANTATTPFVVADLQWIDPASGLVVAEEQWVLPCAGPTAVNTFNGTGPTKAGELTIKFNNLDAAAVATVTIAMLTNSRIYAKDRWLQTVTNNPPGLTVSGGRPLSGIVASQTTFNVPAGAPQTLLLPLYNGDVSFYIDQSGVPAANFTAQLQVAPTNRFGQSAFWSASPAGGTGNGIFQIMRWPRAATLLTLTNTGAVAATVNMKAIALDETH